jgi:RNA polymerase sigma-70 factor (ECF subfamily)
MEITEQNFIKQIKKKNPSALEFVIYHYANLVFNVISGVLNPSYLSRYVDDCINDVFWAVWNNVASFDEEKGSFKNWLAAVAKYKAIDYKRRLFKQSAVECTIDYSLEDKASIESLIISKENSNELVKAINDMNIEDREIFIRRYFLDDRITTIADELQVPRNTVDQRLSRGRKLLKEKLLHLKGEILR